MRAVHAVSRSSTPGRLIKGRYRIAEVLRDDGVPRLYRVTDFYVPSRQFTVREYPVPDGSAELWGQISRGVEAESRILSWLQTPGLVLPRDLFVETGSVYVVEGATHGETLEQFLSHTPIGLRRAARWTLAVCDLLRSLHDAHPAPRYLGRLAMENLAVNDEGFLQLVGFRLGGEFRLVFGIADAATAWSAPEGAVDARSDVWVLGSLLARLMARAEGAAPSPETRELPPLSRGQTRRRAELEAIVQRATHADPARRYETVARLQRDLDRVARHLAPRVAADRAGDPPSWSRRFPVATSLLPFALAVLLLAVVASGMHRIEDGVEALRGGLRRIPLAQLAQLPAGSVVWTEGTVVPLDPQSGRNGAPLVSPLGGAPCLAYTVSLSRTAQREVWDAEQRAYVVRRFDTVLLDRTRCLPFALWDGAVRLRVIPSVPTLLGPALEVDGLPAGPASRVPSTFRTPPLRVGEHPISIRGYERRMVVGERVFLRAQVERVGGQTVLSAPPDAAVIVYRGSWVEYVLGAAASLAPGLLSAWGVIALLWVGAIRIRKRERSS